MIDDQPTPPTGWQEADSSTFIDVGRVMIPRRDEIERTIVELIPATPDDAFTVVDLAAGAGWLSGAILGRHPRARALLLDGSATMLEEAGRNLATYAGRFELRQFRLEDDAKPGRYYAKVAPRTIAGVGNCAKAKSKRVRIG